MIILVWRIQFDYHIGVKKDMFTINYQYNSHLNGSNCIARLASLIDSSNLPCRLKL